MEHRGPDHSWQTTFSHTYDLAVKVQTGRTELSLFQSPEPHEGAPTQSESVSVVLLKGRWGREEGGGGNTGDEDDDGPTVI